MPHSINTRKTRIRNLDISYLSGGRGDPLLVIHGGGEGADAWMNNARELAKYYTVYIPNLPGFGESQAMEGDFDVAHFVSFIDDFADNLGLKRFHLVGHSIGAGIALRYALKSPQNVFRLVLISSVCLGREVAFWINILVSAGMAVLKAVSWMARLFFKPLLRQLLGIRLKLNLGLSMSDWRGQTTVLLDRLSGLMVPTLVVWGGKDPVVPARHAFAAAAAIPNCQVHIFKGCGHSVYREKLREFSQLLTDFLKPR
jgi:pimeloyl-ACP methyl ester carboxylesterase